jgi:hypothetical protein
MPPSWFIVKPWVPMSHWVSIVTSAKDQRDYIGHTRTMPRLPRVLWFRSRFGINVVFVAHSTGICNKSQPEVIPLVVRIWQKNHVTAGCWEVAIGRWGDSCSITAMVMLLFPGNGSYGCPHRKPMNLGDRWDKLSEMRVSDCRPLGLEAQLFASRPTKRGGQLQALPRTEVPTYGRPRDTWSLTCSSNSIDWFHICRQNSHR